MEELLIIDVKITDTFDIFCYEGDYTKLYKDEDKLCHYFKIKFIDENALKKMKDALKEYLMYVDENNKEIEFYNFSNGDSILLKYIELTELDYGHDKIINSKIKYLLEENNKLFETLDKKIHEINNSIIYFNNKLENINKKIIFFEENNNIKNLYKNIGRKEIINEILNIMKNIK
jgi:hypothetical protein